MHNVAIEEEASAQSQVYLLTTGTDESNENLFIATILHKALAVKYNRKNSMKNPSTESDNKRRSRSKRDEKSAAAAEAEAKAGEIAKKWGLSGRKAEALERGLTNIFESVSGAEADMAFVRRQAESLAASAVRLWRILGV